MSAGTAQQQTLGTEPGHDSLVAGTGWYVVP